MDVVFLLVYILGYQHLLFVWYLSEPQVEVYLVMDK